MVFDNRKIKAVVPEFVAAVPFAEGAREIVSWHDSLEEGRKVDGEADAIFERLIERVHQYNAVVT
jgi:hypothetical protein